MAQVLLRIQPPLASQTGSLQSTGSFTLVEVIREGEPLGPVLQRVADRNAAIREALFDTGKGQIKDYIVLMLNARVLRGIERQETQLADGDKVVFMLPFSGG